MLIFSCNQVRTFVRSSIFVRSPDFSALFLNFSCAHFRPSYVHVQVFLCSSGFSSFMFSFSFVHVLTFICSTDFTAFVSRLSCVHWSFEIALSDFRAFMLILLCVQIQTFVRFSISPGYEILNARYRPRAFIFGLEILVTV